MNLQAYYQTGTKARSAKRFKKAFTLVEVMVAVTIFSMAIVVAFAVFSRSIDSQSKSTASKNLQESLSYAMSYMMNDLATARPGGGASCSASACSGDNLFFCSPNEQTLYFMDGQNDCVAYQLVEDGDFNRLRVNRAGHQTFLILGDIDINSFKVTTHNITSLTKPSGFVSVGLSAAHTKGLHREPLLLQSSAVLSEETIDPNDG